MKVDGAAPAHSGSKTLARLRPTRRRIRVLRARIDALSWEAALSTISDWAAEARPRYVAFCNVHSVVTAGHSPEFAYALEGADMALPDGAPIAWAMRESGCAGQQRISGPDVMLACLDDARRLGHPVFFYGGTESTLAMLCERMLDKFPGLVIAGSISPPFGTVPQEMGAAHINEINDSGAKILFVGLGCPKQELWLHANSSSLKMVALGVGAAFDFHAGTAVRAPAWMRDHGLEWLHRLSREPGRLGCRYLTTNTEFVVRMAWQKFRAWRDGGLMPERDRR